MKDRILVLLISIIAFFFTYGIVDAKDTLTVKYESVLIGEQVWMVKNLDVELYRNGDTIPEVKLDTSWAKQTKGAWCYYNNDPTNGAIYGKLYNWYAVTDPRGLAPKGWHIPTEAEWNTLTSYLGGKDIAGGELKDVDQGLWEIPNIGATNGSGFSALPGGFRDGTGKFTTIGTGGDWWSSTVDYSADAWGRYIYYNYTGIYRRYFNKALGFSVRCILD
jgi:uncharacterized protein (TIGR02145 family)